eukprot:COSAG02_NODE_1274_length_13507_cov_8.324060_8_plen_571_part_00
MSKVVNKAGRQGSMSESGKNTAMPVTFDSARRVWCQSPLPHYTLLHQRYVQPARCIPLLRPGRDLIVLPGGHEPTLKMWEFNRDMLGLSDNQVIWTQGHWYNMDKDMDPLTLVELKRRILKQSGYSDKWLLVPYAPNPEFERWALPLIDSLGKDRVSVFGETKNWLNKYGDKGLLHRHMDRLDEPSEIEKIDPSIVVLRGYVCKTTEQLLEARELLSDTECCIKPLAGATGVGIVLCPTNDFLREYDFPLGPVNLEEFLDLDTDGNGEAVSPAVHYIGTETIGGYMLDQIMSGCEYIGWQRTVVSEEFVNEAYRAIGKFLEVARPQGAGGVDFLSVNGKPYLTDINTGRFNGAHASRLFFEMYAPHDYEFYCSKKKLHSHIDLSTCWRMLQNAGLAFVPGTSCEGIYPVLCLHGVKVQLLVVGKNRETVNRLICQSNIVLDSDHHDLDRIRGAHATAHAGTSMANTAEICGICLSAPDSPVELGCSHMFCGRCLLTAHQQHHRRCPICRHEHVLDPIALRDKMNAYRQAYSNWRKGQAKGAHGEPDIIGRVAIDVRPSVQSTQDGDMKKA